MTTMIQFIKRKAYEFGIVRKLSYRRLKYLCKLMGLDLINDKNLKLKILDVGCANGKDFITHFENYHNLDLYGIDVKDRGLKQSNFKLIIKDAEHINFEDNYFDLVVSMGVLEHINPIEKLSQVIKEINRVSKQYFIELPAVDTMIEPHTAKFKWQLKGKHNKKSYHNLNYYSDEAWMSFEGFQSADCVRFSHIPIIYNNIIIFKK